MMFLFKHPLSWLSALTVMVLLSVQTNVQAQQPMTPMQLAMMENVGAVVISSEGTHVAFTKVVPADPRTDNSPSSVELHYMNLMNGEVRQVPLDRNPGGLAARPTLDSFTFVTRMDDDEFNAVYELNPLTGEVRQLFMHTSNMLGYVWDDRGRRLAFFANEEMDLPENPLPYEPIYFEENRPQRLAHVVDLQASNRQVVDLGVTGSYYILSFAPGGAQIAASIAPTPEVDDELMFQVVHVFDSNTGALQARIDNAGKIGQIEWSPNGERLALRAGNSINDPIDGRIMVVSAEGGTPENINPDFLGKYEQIKWTADDTIHFLASEGVWSSFGTIAPDGSNKERLIDLGGPIKRSFSVSDNGHIAFAVDTPEHPREAYLLRRGSDELERLTTTNPWLSEVAMGVQELITYPARDGRMIEGLLIRPFNENEAERYPLITVIHGGPEAHYSNGWLTGYSLPGQLMAARGYAVFYPNYRGSTGRGLEFIKSSQSDLAGAEFDDVVDGVDYLIESGLVDEGRVGATGGSYGGYGTAWMSTYYSDRFAAGVMFVGISNNISKWGTSDIPEELYLVHSRKRLWDYWEGNLRRSPIYYVDRTETPLLIMHGAEDTRVHPAQSLELYRHIKVRKPEVPLRLVLYPNEGHGNVRATSRLDYNLRMIRWFDTYLKGDANQPVPPTHLNFSDFGITFD
ncbi:S9 family peptidase [Cyclonatronum proteinivorum]|nr:prolyl oligopeptidase family serine peptidase [Cyclonatronum proteinivorum]